MKICNHPEQKVLSKLNFFSFLGHFQKNAKKIFLTPLSIVRQYNSPKPYCSPLIIKQGNFHLSKHPMGKDLGGSFLLFFFQINKVHLLSFSKLYICFSFQSFVVFSEVFIFLRVLQRKFYSIVQKSCFVIFRPCFVTSHSISYLIRQLPPHANKMAKVR